MLPFLILSAIFIFIPLIMTVALSFQEVSFLNLSERSFVGLENFKELLNDPTFIKAIKNSFIFVILIVPLTVTISFLLALLTQKESKFNGIARTIFYLPYVLTPVAVAAILTFLFKEDGLFTMFFVNFFGMENISWQTDPMYSKLLIAFAVIWVSVGFYMTLYITALKAIPKEIFEAAKVDGVNKIAVIKNIILPSVKHITFLAIFMSTLSTIQLFDIPYIISTTGGTTAGSPTDATMTPVMYIYTEGFIYNNAGVASAAAIVLILIIACATLFQYRFLGGKDE